MCVCASLEEKSVGCNLKLLQSQPGSLHTASVHNLMAAILTQFCCYYRRAIPPSARHGSRIVLRQGSPLLPSDLSNVAAGSARATIIISDESKSRDAADAQSLRWVFGSGFGQLQQPDMCISHKIPLLCMPHAWAMHTCIPQSIMVVCCLVTAEQNYSVVRHRMMTQPTRLPPFAFATQVCHPARGAGQLQGLA